ncbi:MAG: protein translocase subunit SecA 1 [Pirellulaceae bacterium]|nr:MAG: protein translocase subunit SecA 1 [Pirellulaceae bacterium]GIW93161.1 MAG: protein translocase subunit SecA 1 [Pirellulaceae bacterium]
MEILERVWEGITVVCGSLMQGVERGITSLFGSANARVLKRLEAKVAAINALEPRYREMTDAQLRDQTRIFRERLAGGETLDDLLIEAFAVCREAGRRFLNMRHFDVQLIGGMVLHSGNIAEMVTGEGKTLVATLPAYLNALEGRGVHVVTVNDYLARRDMEWMGPLYLGLGLTVGAIQANMGALERQRAYDCDITYGTNNEFGFDYLRDNMRPAARGDDRYPREYQQVQRGLNYAIIDEVDNILIDEARTPLIISGPAHENIARYTEADRIARLLKKDVHFVVNEKDHTVHLTDEGVREAERLAGVDTFYTAANMEWPHLIDNALKAHHLYKRDVHYVVKEGRVVIVDEFTGRLMEGRQWSDGLHQAVEAKEGVRIKEETQTLATITLQNYFKLYRKICGMTGTAMTEADEFWKIYHMDVVAIPTNKPLRRIEYPDVIYRTEREKFQAVADEIERLHRWDTLYLTDHTEMWGEIIQETDTEVHFVPKGEREPVVYSREQIASIERKGRPILVGTVSIEKSERLSKLLAERGIKHEVLNAKHHQREAEIIAQAGRPFAVTIATNMAGRGTDIILGGNPETMAWARLQHKYPTRLDVPRDEWERLVAEIEAQERTKEQGEFVKKLGGLHVIGTERHEARRIDLQLRGRCGRQGDPGSSRFFLSLEDDLMRIFAGPWVKAVLERLGMREGDRIESRAVTRRIAAAQKKVEELHFERRKNLLEYDEVMDEQRKRVYAYRQRILDGLSCREVILNMIADEIRHHVGTYLHRDYGVESFAAWVSSQLSAPLDPKDFRGLDFESAADLARTLAERHAETSVQAAIDENLPRESDEADWNWNALAQYANTAWKARLGERDLKRVGRDMIDTFLLEKAREAIAQADLSPAAKFLDPDYPLLTTITWVKSKFGIELTLDELRGKEPEAIQSLIIDRAVAAYEERESTYPVLVALERFSSHTGGRQVNVPELLQWARQRLGCTWSEEDLRHKSVDQITQELIEYSRRSQQLANQMVEEVKRRLAEAFQAGEEVAASKAARAARLQELRRWLETELQVPWKSPWDDADRARLEQLLVNAVEDRFRPEIRQMERMVLLEIVDTAWKDHLLAMDHLLASIRLAGYAQLDPKVEYKREGMRMFQQMWRNIGERVTELVFRIHVLDTNILSSLWVETSATHAEAPQVTAQHEPEAMGTSAEGDGKIETFRYRADRVGRNDPCPCGSGKKYKHCCLRKGRSGAA